MNQFRRIRFGKVFKIVVTVCLFSLILVQLTSL
jgi:hypothetical protein